MCNVNESNEITVMNVNVYAIDFIHQIEKDKSPQHNNLQIAVLINAKKCLKWPQWPSKRDARSRRREEKMSKNQFTYSRNATQV